MTLLAAIHPETWMILAGCASVILLAFFAGTSGPDGYA